MWALLLKLPWKVIGPILVVAALALCVRLHVQNNARAEAWQQATKIAADYTAAVERKRLTDRKVMEDSVAKLRAMNAQEAQARIKITSAAYAKSVRLRRELTERQRKQLDSLEADYNEVIKSQQSENARLETIIRLRTSERDDAENSLAALQRENVAIRAALDASNKRTSSTGWKIATGVSAASALVLGVVAATK